jgi:hypothetical protein
MNSNSQNRGSFISPAFPISSKSPVPVLSSNGRLEPTKLLTHQEVAERLQVPASWVAWRTRPRCSDPLPFIRIGKITRLEWSAIERWLAEHRENGNG